MVIDTEVVYTAVAVVDTAIFTMAVVDTAKFNTRVVHTAMVDTVVVYGGSGTAVVDTAIDDTSVVDTVRGAYSIHSMPQRMAAESGDTVVQTSVVVTTAGGYYGLQHRSSQYGGVESRTRW